ncbi:MAG: glycosyltransferase family 2 protein [Chitinophagaceae bacterium]|nr:glycosyltransferase family 2 protein [Chitinophagaceae bacterium]
MPNIRVIIPVLNEQNAIALVLQEIPKQLVQEIIVVDNGSTDDTYKRAKEMGATVLKETERGYGNACLRGIQYIRDRRNPTDIVVFLDGDHSDFPEQMTDLVKPLIEEGYDLVIGSRMLGKREKGSLTPQQIYGNWLATFLLKIIYKVHYSDLGPFRAIKYDALLKIEMQDKTYGWTVEMQLKAAKQKLKITEIPINYRRRIGFSKISGTLKGTLLAGYKIIYTIFKYL